MPQDNFNLGLVVRGKKRIIKADTLRRKYNSYCQYDFDMKSKTLNKVTTSVNGYGEVISRDKFIILKLHGTQYEMGYQHGFLLAKEINEPIENQKKSKQLYPNVSQVKYWSDFLDKDYIKPLLTGFWDIFTPAVKSLLIPAYGDAVMADRIPNDIFRSLHGVYSGYKKGLEVLTSKGEVLSDDELDFEDFIKGYVQPDIVNIFLRRALGKGSTIDDIAQLIGRNIIPLPIPYDWSDCPLSSLGCSTVAFLPEKTLDGSLLFGNDFDYSPLAGLWEKNLTVVYCDPLSEGNEKTSIENHDEKKPQKYLFITSPGIHAGLIGVNESGIAFRVHNNFTRDTDEDFADRGKNNPHGQPLLNFCNNFLRFATNIVTDNKDFIEIKNSIRNSMNYIGDNKKTTNTPISGWTFLLAQNKGGNAKVYVYETTFSALNNSLVEIPYYNNEDPIDRFNLIKNLNEIQNGDPIKAIWQTNFFTSANLKEHEIFRHRSAQLNNLNRFIRAGLGIRNQYPAGGFSWKDVATILSDDKDIFSGSGDGVRRLNLNTIASNDTVTTIIYSLNNNSEGEKPSIKFHLAFRADKRTPTCWGDYYEFDFNELDKSSGVESYKPINQGSINGHNSSDSFYLAMIPFYDAYCHYTFNEEDERDYGFLINKIKESRENLDGTEQSLPQEPFIDYLLGRLYINKAKSGTNVADLVIALTALDNCVRNIGIVYDPHLITLARYFIVKVCYTLYDQNHNIKYLKQASDTLNILINDELYYRKGDSFGKLYEALKPYLKPTPDNVIVEKKMKYIKDHRLMDAINSLRDKNSCTYDGIEKDISFSACDLYKYKA